MSDRLLIDDQRLQMMLDQAQTWASHQMVVPYMTGEELLAILQALLDARNERETLRARVKELDSLLGNFDKRCADALADEVAALVRRRVIDSRSPAADALLDYREPPATERSDRIAELEKRSDRAVALLANECDCGPEFHCRTCDAATVLMGGEPGKRIRT